MTNNNQYGKNKMNSNKIYRFNSKGEKWVTLSNKFKTNLKDYNLIWLFIEIDMKNS